MPHLDQVARSLPLLVSRDQHLVKAYLVVREALLKELLYLGAIKQTQLAKAVFLDRIRQAVLNSQLELPKVDFSGTLRQPRARQVFSELNKRQQLESSVLSLLCSVKPQRNNNKGTRYLDSSHSNKHRHYLVKPKLLNSQVAKLLFSASRSNRQLLGNRQDGNPVAAGRPSNLSCSNSLSSNNSSSSDILRRRQKQYL